MNILDKKNKYNLIFLALFFCAMFFSAVNAVVFADGTTCAQQCYDCAKHQLNMQWPPSPFGGAKLTSCSKLPDLIKYLYGWGVSLGGIAVFIALVIAGFQYITSIGNPGKMKEAISRIQNAAIGLALLLGSYAIFQLINPNITTLKGSLDLVSSNEPPCNAPTDCCTRTIITTDANGKQTTTLQVDPTCNADDWKCCLPNDIKCMNPDSDNTAKTDINTNQTGCCHTKEACPGKVCDNSCCCSDNDCISGYCNTQTNMCETPKKICVQKIEQELVGCDKVTFYSGPQFKGLPGEPDHLDSVDSAVNSATFTKFPPGFSPQSFQAFKKDKDGNYVPCGSSGCGCAVILCLQLDASASGKCAADQTQENASQPLIAYEPVYQDTRVAQAYIIQNPAKKNSNGNSIITNITNFWNSVSGFLGGL